MLQKVIHIILAIAIVEGRIARNRQTAAEAPLPTFEDVPCPASLKASLCISVNFGTEFSELMLLTQESDTLYLGYLDNEFQTMVVMIEENGSRLINFHDDRVPHCCDFDVDLETNTVECVRGGYETNNDDEEFTELANRGITNGNTNGPIVPLGTSFPNGIDVKVLFHFDNDFYKAFGAEGTKQVIALVANAFTDNSLVKRIGTKVNIIGEGRKYDGTFTDEDFPWRNGQIDTCRLGKMAKAEGAKYDLYTFVTHPGASGVALGGQACSTNPKLRISMNKAYGPRQCHYYQPPTAIDCSKPANRIALTAETISHELGHSLGMAHDFKSKRPYVYRKYEGEGQDCRGLMDYIDDGVGWSACSARDFSRYLTNGGTGTPCLLKGTTATCVDTDDNSTGDPWGDGCKEYAKYKHWCGKYDDSDFESKVMCCACGGGKK